jgi:hypothetical protein
MRIAPIPPAEQGFIDIDPEQAEASRQDEADTMGIVEQMGDEAQTSESTSSEKFFVLYPVEYEGITVSKYSEVMTVVNDIGDVQYIRERNLPNAVDATVPEVDPEAAISIARSDAQATFDDAPDLDSNEPALEIWVDSGGQGHLTWTFYLRSPALEQPIARQYWVTAVGEPKVLFWEDQIDHDFEGTVSGRIWETSPFDAEGNRLLGGMRLTDSNGGSTATQTDGGYTLPGVGSVTVNGTLSSHAAVIDNRAGAEITRSQAGNDASPIDLDFNASGDLELAQVTAYHYTNLVRQFAESILDPTELADLPVRVNINDQCNAFWDRIEQTINFFQAGGPCPNTAYLDVIAHEIGHGIDQMKGLILDRGYSEGFGDAIALMFMRQPCVGRNIFGVGTCLRNATDVHMWPPAANERVHDQGRRYGQFVWLVKEELAKVYAEDAAFALTTHLTLAAAAGNPSDIPDAVMLTFIADDDDGDLSNGTPHFAALASAADARNLPRPATPVTTSSGRIGYVWANQPSSPTYTPSTTYAHNSTDGAITITRGSTGHYAVRFAGLGGSGHPGGHVQVTAYGSGSEACKVASWASGGADFIANVRCFNAAGALIDTRYTVLVFGPKAGPTSVALAN